VVSASATAPRSSAPPHGALAVTVAHVIVGVHYASDKINTATTVAAVRQEGRRRVGIR
jgi:hypothetical protein